jgi:penicillin-binding protein 1A
MDHGFTPSSIMLDEPFVIDQGVGLPKWKPSNYTHKFYGPLTLRTGVEQSRNLITARLGEAVGLEPIGETIERFGIMDHMPRQYAQVLGAGETTPLKLTTAYAANMTDVASVTEPDMFGRAVSALDASVRSSAPRTGFPAPVLPGTGSAERKQRSQIDGVDVASEIWGQVADAVAGLGVHMPEPVS